MSTHVHTRTHTLILSHAYTHVCICKMHTHTNTHTYTRTHTHTHIRTPSLTHTTTAFPDYSTAHPSWRGRAHNRRCSEIVKKPTCSFPPTGVR